MATNPKKTGFKQYTFCSFCRFNHRKGKKHLYSTKHQTIINNILEKFYKKISTATKTLSDPELESLSFEVGVRFWCYFCSEEIVTHSKLDACTLKFGGLLEHIARSSHGDMCSKFFKDNRIDETVKDRSKYSLTEDKLLRFKKLAALGVRKYVERQNLQNMKIATQIRHQEIKRRNLDQWDHWKSESQISNELAWEIAQWHQQKASNSAVHTASDGISTLSAHGQGLTFIGSQEFDADMGNVHTGGLPPWLQIDQSERNQNAEIGPTISDYKKHLEREKKKKLPACRVGAKFDRNQASKMQGLEAKQWLPSFGRVWNHGRREQSKIFFQNEVQKSSKSDFVKTSTNLFNGTRQEQTNRSQDIQESCRVPQNVQPYQRKRKLDQTSGNNSSSVQEQSISMSNQFKQSSFEQDTKFVIPAHPAHMGMSNFPQHQHAMQNSLGYCVVNNVKPPSKQQYQRDDGSYISTKEQSHHYQQEQSQGCQGYKRRRPVSTNVNSGQSDNASCVQLLQTPVLKKLQDK